MRELFNTYLGYATLVLQGTPEFVLRREGVQQGDPWSILMYARAVLPLSHVLTDRDRWDQNWYADDSACAAKLSRLRELFDRLTELGPDFCYYPEPWKTIVVVKPEDQAEVRELFDDLGIVVKPGQRFLGSFIGDHEGTQEFVEQKVQE